MVLLAFAESETASTTTLGLGFPTVWVQTPHRFGLFYIGHCPLHFVSYMERDWVFRNCVCLYCHLFFFVACTLLREIYNMRSRLSICLEFLSRSHFENLKSCIFVWERSGIIGTLLLPWLCILAVCFSFTCQFCTFLFC